MTFFSPASLLPASASRRDNQPNDELCLERAGVGSWRVCNSRVARGEGRFVAFIDEKDDAFEVMELADDFVWTGFPTMSEAFAHVARAIGEAPTAEPKVWTR